MKRAKTLVVTGKLAYETVEKSVGDLADIIKVDIDVASFITPDLLIKYLACSNDYDLILIPGLISADFSELEDEIGIPIRLGPKHATDLRFVLRNLHPSDFSDHMPACELIRDKIRAQSSKDISEFESEAEPSFMLRDLKIGGDSRMKVMAEVVDSDKLTVENLEEKINYFVSNGADIIDLGMSMDASPHDAKRIIRYASQFDVPMSIDTNSPSLILAGMYAGVDLILTLNSKNISAVGDKVAEADVAAVVTLDSLSKARKLGIRKVIADPILTPIPHLLDSLVRYRDFRRNDEETPLFFGVGNVIELLDADSIGANAILAGLALEVNASILFAPEHSDKARGCISELNKASKLMLLASRYGKTKDLGIDMLTIKEKRRREGLEIGGEEIIYARPSNEWKLDPKGCFRIGLSSDKIMAKQKNTFVVGEHAKDVLDTILERDMISSADHAGYLGRELMKAELALRFRRSYFQDDKF